MPSECADGHRKPPKYLSDTSTKRARTRRRRGVSSEQQPCQSNQSHELAFAERERQTMSSQSIEETFEAFIDSSLYNTAKPITEVGGRNFMSPAAKGNEWLNQSCQSGGDWQFAETSPSDSDNSEESTAYQCLGERVRVNPAEKQAFPEDNLHLGFTISSGWSGTFFPNGVDDKP
ncbi:hypothetical protein N7452_001074 [Penicillium brevicompactum]|uniref:Uncharacterized protein n=1 Tax=Penicillium brevicompactum TaxID=5074 RepID=A0A9W9R1W1_PENBR|nr:hypothetical protein N7452_001074 [Penicillium brevicompactum]